MPALMLSVTASISTLNPALAGAMPTMFCRYIGRKMCRPTIGPQPNALAAIASRASRLPRIDSGMSGSGAVRSRTMKAMPSSSAAANSARIGVDSHG